MTNRPKAQRKAFENRAVKQIFRQWRYHQDRDAIRTCRPTEHRDVLRVASERSDVLLHPFESGNLVEEAIVAGNMTTGFRGEVRMR
jgi:hypothetical protein